MTTTMVDLDLTLFTNGAGLIEQNGFWDGSPELGNQGRECIWLAVSHAGGSTTGHAEYLARQLGWDPDSGDPLGYIYNKNDEFKGRPEEGKAWAVETLRRLGRGESLV